MKQFLKLFLALFLISMLVVACSKDDNKSEDNTKNLLYLFIIDQTGSNCAIISKSTSSGKTTYTAAGTLVPKGGCNAGTLDTSAYTTSSNEAVTKIQAKYDAYAAIAAKSSNCSALKSYYETLKSGVTSSSIETSANNSSSKCTTSNGVVYCKTDSDITTLKGLKQYLTVDSVTSDMQDDLNYDIASIKASNTTAGYGFSDTAIAAMSPVGPKKLATLNSNEYAVILQSLFGIYDSTTFKFTPLPTSCRDDLYAAYPDVKTLLTAIGGKAYGASAAEATAVTSVVDSSLFGPSLSCQYGDGYTSTTLTVSGTSFTQPQKCPSNYPTF